MKFPAIQGRWLSMRTAMAALACSITGVSRASAQPSATALFTLDHSITANGVTAAMSDVRSLAAAGRMVGIAGVTASGRPVVFVVDADAPSTAIGLWAPGTAAISGMVIHEIDATLAVTPSGRYFVSAAAVGWPFMLGEPEVSPTSNGFDDSLWTTGPTASTSLLLDRTGSGPIHGEGSGLVRSFASVRATADGQLVCRVDAAPSVIGAPNDDFVSGSVPGEYGALLLAEDVRVAGLRPVSGPAVIRSAVARPGGAVIGLLRAMNANGSDAQSLLWKGLGAGEDVIELESTGSRFRRITLFGGGVGDTCQGEPHWFAAGEMQTWDGHRQSGLIRDGAMLHREGDTINGYTLVAGPIGADMNANGDLVMVWPAIHDSVTATVLFVNSTPVLWRGAGVDVDDDDAVDATVSHIYGSVAIGDVRVDANAVDVYAFVKLEPSSGSTSGAAPAIVRVRATPRPPTCVADFDRSGGTPDSEDIGLFFAAWLVGDEWADIDCSGGTPDAMDVDQFFGAWLSGC